MLMLVLTTCSLLKAINLELINNTNYEGELLKNSQGKIYLKVNRTLLVINSELIQNEIPPKQAKVKYNSFRDVMLVETESDLSNLPELQINTELLAESLTSRNFLFLELSSIIYGYSVGINYEIFLSKSIAISAGYYIGRASAPIFFSNFESKYSSVPIGIQFMPNIQKTFIPELGIFVEYFRWETTERFLMSSDINVIEKDEEFIPSVKTGFRFQPKSEGFTFKSGGKIFLKDKTINPGLYLNVGLRF